MQFENTYATDTYNAVITIAIRLRYDYDPTTTYPALLLPIRRKQKNKRQFFVVVVS